MQNLNDDSDEEFNYDFPDGKNASHSDENAPSKYAEPIVQDFAYDEPEDKYKGPNENDLEVEDWNYDLPSTSSQAPADKTSKSKRQELIEAQKKKLTKDKKFYDPTAEGKPLHKKSKDAPTLDDMYNNEYESKIKKMDQQLEGEIQHESLK